jgi:hypothetical protein
VATVWSYWGVFIGQVRSGYDGKLLFSSFYYLGEYHSRLGLD